MPGLPQLQYLSFVLSLCFASGINDLWRKALIRQASALPLRIYQCCTAHMSLCQVSSSSICMYPVSRLHIIVKFSCISSFGFLSQLHIHNWYEINPSSLFVLTTALCPCNIRIIPMDFSYQTGKTTFRFLALQTKSVWNKLSMDFYSFFCLSLHQKNSSTNLQFPNRLKP